MVYPEDGISRGWMVWMVYPEDGWYGRYIQRMDGNGMGGVSREWMAWMVYPEDGWYGWYIQRMDGMDGTSRGGTV